MRWLDRVAAWRPTDETAVMIAATSPFFFCVAAVVLAAVMWSL